MWGKGVFASLYIFERTTPPCDYVMGVREALVAGIPGLKRETWGTLRVFL